MRASCGRLMFFPTRMFFVIELPFFSDNLLVGAGISFFSKVAVKELYLMRLRIIDHKTAAMDEHQQRDELDRRWNIQIEPLGGRPPGIRQMPICIAATPLVHLYMSDWCRQIIPDYALHTQYRGDMPFLIHSVGLLY